MKRERLPNRRQSVSFPLVWRNRRYEITAAFFDDGRPAEAFVANAKAGTDIQGLSRDGAVILSLALQHGCPLETIRSALTRDEQEEPSSLIGALVDAFAAEIEYRTLEGAG